MRPYSTTQYEALLLHTLWGPSHTPPHTVRPYSTTQYEALLLHTLWSPSHTPPHTMRPSPTPPHYEALLHHTIWSPTPPHYEALALLHHTLWSPTPPHTMMPYSTTHYEALALLHHTMRPYSTTLWGPTPPHTMKPYSTTHCEASLHFTSLSRLQREAQRQEQTRQTYISANLWPRRLVSGELPRRADPCPAPTRAEGVHEWCGAGGGGHRGVRHGAGQGWRARYRALQHAQELWELCAGGGPRRPGWCHLPLSSLSGLTGKFRVSSLHLHLHLGFVHPLQDVALHQCLPLSSVCCCPNPGGSLLLCNVI